MAKKKQAKDAGVLKVISPTDMGFFKWHVVTCAECSAEEAISAYSRNETDAANIFTNRGWRVCGQEVMCPDCIEERGVK